jgi:hypothetical protein
MNENFQTQIITFSPCESCVKTITTFSFEQYLAIVTIFFIIFVTFCLHPKSKKYITCASVAAFLLISNVLVLISLFYKDVLRAGTGLYVRHGYPVAVIHSGRIDVFKFICSLLLYFLGSMNLYIIIKIFIKSITRRS